MQITFTPLTENHLELMHDWLNRPHVKLWWGNQQMNIEQVEAKYKPRISGSIPCYGDFPDYASQIFTTSDAEKFDLNSIACIDVFIADENFLNKGFGQLILRKFLSEIVFEKMQATICILGPVIENKSAIRAYEKVGFTHWKTVQVEQSGTEFIMMIAKDLPQASDIRSTYQ